MLCQGKHFKYAYISPITSRSRPTNGTKTRYGTEIKFYLNTHSFFKILINLLFIVKQYFIIFLNLFFSLLLHYMLLKKNILK